MSAVSERMAAARARDAARAVTETRADLYQRASAEAFAALQQAAIDALDTASVTNDAIALLEASRSIEPDERTAIIAVLQLIPAVRAERAAQQQAKEQG
jgi:hypothetical protein